MSEENVEIVRRAIGAYGLGGLDGTLRYYDPEIEWTSTGDYIERATQRRKIEREPSRPAPMITEPGLGYRFIG